MVVTAIHTMDGATVAAITGLHLLVHQNQNLRLDRNTRSPSRPEILAALHRGQRHARHLGRHREDADQFIFSSSGTPAWWPEFCGAETGLIGVYLVITACSVGAMENVNSLNIRGEG